MSMSTRLGRLPSTFAPILLGRILPRVHSPLASPTVQTHFAQSVTPEGVAIVRVPYQRFNEFFNRYFEHEEDLYALDSDSLSARVGDLVLVRRLEKPHQKNVQHKVESIVQRLGDFRDYQGNPVAQGEYRSRAEAVDRLYGRNPRGYDRSKARERGWQSGRRDFTDRVTYYKWHVFDPKHDDGNSVTS